MSSWFVWALLSGITGSPLGALALLVVGGWVLDHFTFRALPDPLQGVGRWRRVEQLRRRINDNPQDRRARLELADLLLLQRRPSAAYDVLRPSVDGGDRDPATLYLLGLAARGSGKLDEAAKLLEQVFLEEPDFKLSLIRLELAEVCLAKGDGARAAELLGEYLGKRRSSVRARVVLARVKQAAGDAEAARRLKEEAWREYVGLPRYLRRDERLWAWRAKPERPLLYGALLVGFGAGAVYMSM